MRDYVPMMNDIATQLMQKWERLNPGEPVEVTADMTRLTLDTIALCVRLRFNSFYRDVASLRRGDVRGVGRKLETRPGTAHPDQAAARRLPQTGRELPLHGERSQQIIDERRRAGNVEDHRICSAPC